MQSFMLVDEQAMIAFGMAFAQHNAGALRIYLDGQLAAGKTTFARGFLRGCGHRGAVKSPTFTLVETYALNNRLVHHFDLYRIADPEELLYLGLDDYFADDADCLVEWSVLGDAMLPEPDVHLQFDVDGTRRIARLRAHSLTGKKLLEEIEQINEFSCI